MGQKRPGQKSRNVTLFVQTVTRLERIRESKRMSLEDEIKNILFEIGKDIKVHKLIDGNLIIEIDYEKYSNEILELFKKYR